MGPGIRRPSLGHYSALSLAMRPWASHFASRGTACLTWKNRKNAAWPPSLQGLQRSWPLGRTRGQAETLSETWAPDESSDCNCTQTRSMRDRAGLGRKDPEASFHCFLLWLQAALPWGPAYWPPSTSRAFWQREQSSSVANTSRQCIV